jgi:hypothetical protein
MWEQSRNVIDNQQIGVVVPRPNADSGVRPIEVEDSKVEGRKVLTSGLSLRSLAVGAGRRSRQDRPAGLIQRRLSSGKS